MVRYCKVELLKQISYVRNDETLILMDTHNVIKITWQHYRFYFFQNLQKPQKKLNTKRSRIHTSANISVKGFFSRAGTGVVTRACPSLVCLYPILLGINVSLREISGGMAFICASETYCKRTERKMLNNFIADVFFAVCVCNSALKLLSAASLAFLDT